MAQAWAKDQCNVDINMYMYNFIYICISLSSEPKLTLFVICIDHLLFICSSVSCPWCFTLSLYTCIWSWCTTTMNNKVLIYLKCKVQLYWYLFNTQICTTGFLMLLKTLRSHIIFLTSSGGIFIIKFPWIIVIRILMINPLMSSFSQGFLWAFQQRPRMVLSRWSSAVIHCNQSRTYGRKSAAR